MRNVIRTAIAMLALTFAALLATAQPAFARSYSIPEVHIDATVGEDGSLTVVEDRTFAFDGSFNGVYWDIPKGEGVHFGQDIEVEVVEIGEVVDSGFKSFEPGSGGSGVYELNNYYSVINVKLYNKKSDERATYRIVYRVTGGLLVWDDCAELYWKFVSDGWDEPSKNVTCDIHLPVPAGTAVTAEDNVRVWGHGPLTGDVEVTSDGARYQVDKVGTSEYAEARVTFPAEWVSVDERQQGNRLQEIINEETAWADAANAQRERAKQIVRIGGIIGAATALFSGAAALFARWRYKQAHKAVFDDIYLRDVPTSDHPAVLGAIYNGGDVRDKEFTASLMRLSDAGAVGLDLVRSAGEEDYRITRNDAVADKLDDEIDRETDYFLFRYLSLRSAEDRNERTDTGFPALDFKDIKKIAKQYPASYEEQHKAWEREVTRVCDKRKFFEEASGMKMWPLITIGVIDILAAVAVFIFTVVIDAPFPVTLVASAALIAIGVFLFVVAGSIKPLSSEAVEIKAQLGALRRWLVDFTRLEEAVPGDVVLWNRLLIMAVVLGVSDKVIEQLRLAKPELMSDPGFVPTYTWCVGHGSLDAPSSSMTRSVRDATSASVAALSVSTSSSGGGGGGGFSGGGGGGFGGGGGGGAF